MNLNIINELKAKGSVVTHINGVGSIKMHYLNKKASFESKPILKLLAFDNEVSKFVSNEAKEQGFPFVTVSRTNDAQSIFENGSVDYFYFFSTNKYDTVLSEDILQIQNLFTFSNLIEN